LFIFANNSALQVSVAIKEQVFLKEEDSSCEEDKEPKLQPHICVQISESRAAEGHVSGAHCLGQRDPVQQRLPGRSSPQLGSR